MRAASLTFLLLIETGLSVTHLRLCSAPADPRSGREQAKLGLIGRFYERGYSRERILSLYRFIDWLLVLPPEAELRVQRAIARMEEERGMPHITSAERIGREQGRAEGRHAEEPDFPAGKSGSSICWGW